MSHSIVEQTSQEVASHIARNPVAIIPLGSTEQHGPHLPNGTDIIAAEVISGALAATLDALIVPFGPYGVTPIHAGHAGTINLRRTTFEALLSDICIDLVGMGIKKLVLVNWHEGNIASIDGVATEIQASHDGVYVIASHACYVAQRIYAEQGGELSHGGGIEAMAVMAHDPGLVHIDRAGDSTRPSRAMALDEMRRHPETHGYITDVTEIDPGGWYGDPGWAVPELAGEFAATMAAEIAESVRRIFALRDNQ